MKTGRYTWDDVYKRAVKFASALSKIGIKKGDTVSFLAFNTPEIFEGTLLSANDRCSVKYN